MCLSVYLNADYPQRHILTYCQVQIKRALFFTGYCTIKEMML